MKQKAALKQIEFQVTAAPGSKVSVAGTFNSWDAGKHPMKDNPASGQYKTSIALPPGKHQYKFVINGAWSVDPNCKERVPDGYGAMNSVLSVQA